MTALEELLPLGKLLPFKLEKVIDIKTSLIALSKSRKKFANQYELADYFVKNKKRYFKRTDIPYYTLQWYGVMFAMRERQNLLEKKIIRE